MCTPPPSSGPSSERACCVRALPLPAPASSRWASASSTHLVNSLFSNNPPHPPPLSAPLDINFGFLRGGVDGWASSASVFLQRMSESVNYNPVTYTSPSVDKVKYLMCSSS